MSLRQKLRRLKSVFTPQLGSGLPSRDDGHASATSLVSQNISQRNRPSPTPRDTGSTGIGTWKHLNGFLGMLEQCTGAFSPLKAVVDELVLSTSVYKSLARDRKDFALLQKDLEAIFQQLQRQFSNGFPPTITECVESLCSSIQVELEFIKRKQTEGVVRGIVTAGDEADQVLDSYRRIQTNLQRLTLNVDLSLWNIVDELAMNARLDRLHPSLSACYNSNKAAELERGSCIPGTRVDVLFQMSGWIANNAAGSLYWLNGMAGTGKTTLAFSLCTELELTHKLGASFFCSRLLPECRDTSRIFPSIAYQLARFSQPFRSVLSRVLEIEQDIGLKDLSVQFEKLIIRPLEEVRNTLPTSLVVVIDALDECENKASTGRVIRALLVDALNLPIKFFMTSRPEPQIREEMKSQVGRRAVSRLVLHELDKGTVQGDIEVYLRSGLGSMNPTESELLALTGRAGVLFIYAATVIRYVGYANFSRNPRRRLKNVLEASSPSGTNPYKVIDDLYTLVLSAALGDQTLDANEIADTREILFTVACVHQPLTTSALSVLSGLHDVDRVDAALAPLWSVLHVVEPKKLVTILHASFSDYIFDPTRSKQYYCDPAAKNHTLILGCLDAITLNNPQFNICGLESSYVPDDEVPGLKANVEATISEETSYACRYWETHLQCAKVSQDVSDRLYEFLSSSLLLWMEVANLRNYIDTGVEMVQRTEEWCLGQSCTEELKELVHDAWRFVSGFASNPVSRSTPHIYVSMLAFWPKSTPIHNHYARRMRGMIQPKGTAMFRRSLSLIATWCTTGSVTSLIWASDSTRVAFVSDGQIRFVNPLTGQLVSGLLNTHTHTITAIGFSPDNVALVFGSQDGAIHVQDSQTGNQLLGPLKGHTKEIRSIAFAPDNSLIASGSDDFTVRIWNAKNGKSIHRPLKGHTNSVNSIAFSPNGARIASGSNDCSIQIWHVETGQTIIPPFLGHTAEVFSVAFSPDGTHVVSGSGDWTVRVWDGQTGQLVTSPFEGHTRLVKSVSFSPDGSRIVSASYDKTIRVWDARSGETVLGPLVGHVDLVLSAAFSSDGTRIVSGSTDKTLRIWDAQSRHASLVSLLSHDFTTSVELSFDGTQVACNSRDTSLQMQDVQGEQMMHHPLEQQNRSTSLATFAPSLTRLVSGSDSSTLRVWNMQAEQPVLTPSEEHIVSVLSFSPDSTRILTSSSSHAIEIWDAQTGQSALGPLRGHIGAVSSVAFSSDGARFASASQDATIRIWDIQNGQLVLGPLKGHVDSVTSVSFSPDGTLIASGSDDNTVRVWDAQSGKPVLGPFEGHTHPVISVAFSPDGAHIISKSKDGTILLWDVRGQSTIQHDGSFIAPPFPCKINPDGWVTDSGGASKLLVWVPSDLCPRLLPPGAQHAIAPHGELRVSFDGAFVGDSWAESYRPDL